MELKQVVSIAPLFLAFMARGENYPDTNSGQLSNMDTVIVHFQQP